MIFELLYFFTWVGKLILDNNDTQEEAIVNDPNAAV